MVYCEKEPYFTNAHLHFLDHVNHFETLFLAWMMREYSTVLLNKDGSYSDNRDQHWAFNSEKDRTLFMLRWS